MKLFKSIYRLDFPPAFGLIDNLGRFAQFLHKSAGEKPFEASNTNVNLAEHSVVSRMKVGTDPVAMNLSTSSLDFVIEYGTGTEFVRAFEHPAVALGGQVVERLQNAGVSSLARVGTRHWILIERSEFRFESLRSSLLGRLPFGGSLETTGLAKVEDVAIVLEGRTQSGPEMRLLFGPYRKSEWRKYFAAEKKVSEALIVDADVWQTKLEIPGFSLEAAAKQHERSVRDVVRHLVDQLLGELR